MRRVTPDSTLYNADRRRLFLPPAGSVASGTETKLAAIGPRMIYSRCAVGCTLEPS